jgi:scyllo-inosamine-4-phosphate amidinotransferase 1
MITLGNYNISMIQSFNEWDTLREIVVGSATGANWPSQDPVFAQEHQRTTWTKSPVPSGAVPQWIIDETNEDLQDLVDILCQAHVHVHRPRANDFVASQGMYNYCPRDRILVAGTELIDTAMMYPCRDQEITYLDMVTDQATVIRMPRDQGMVLDAANVCRLGDTWLCLISVSGNQRAVDWLHESIPHITIDTCNFYSGVHIDSTVVPLRQGLVMLRSDKVNPNNCPRVFDSWEKIWVEKVVAQDFYQYPWASDWIAMNILSISPDTVIMDADQTHLRRQLERRGITVIPHRLRHSRTLGGGYHCVTLDLWRESL